MSNRQLKREGHVEIFTHPITASDVIEIGDMVAAASALAVPASDYTYGAGGGTYASLALAQKAFRDAFLGVSRKASNSLTTDDEIEIEGDGVFEFDCASASFAFGDLVGPAGNTTPTPDALSNQAVVAVTDPSCAIGRVWKATTSQTKVLVKIFSTKLGKTVNSQALGQVYNLSFPINLASITGAMDVVTEFVPGHKFKIESSQFIVTVPVTTAAKAATLNFEIGTTNLTGGGHALTSANCTPLGAQVAEAAPITAANEGSETDSFSVEAASVTAFSEGAGVLVVKIRNLSL